MPELLRAEGLARSFVTAHRRVEVLRDCSLSLAAGETLAIQGTSGSGKSTLLHILGTLDRPDAGRLSFAGRDLLSASARAASDFRRRELGFIFQFHHLLPEFSALENVALPALIGGARRAAASARASELLAQVGLGARSEHRPGELSGGEQQRVAVARALIARPRLVLADEPTGNLDAGTGLEVATLLFALCAEAGAGLLLVTHDQALALRAARRLRLADGRLSPD
ncbi:ABC transporter ATP-binding protein [bacterium]|nr:ABC transporter ATP-binding protein [bacterium]